MRKLGVEEWLVSAVMSVYTGAKTVVRTVLVNNNGVLQSGNLSQTKKNFATATAASVVNS